MLFFNTLFSFGVFDKACEVQVVVELAWDLPTDHVVTMDMWMSSASIESNKFLKAGQVAENTI